MNRSKSSKRRPSKSGATGESPQRRAKKAKSRPQKLRIIGGSMGGRTVVYHGEDFTRPMKDSVRESLFNIIGPRIKGTEAIDLFAGTGAVALESISRGAVRAVAVEKNRRAHTFLKDTAETLGAADRVALHFGDAFRIGAGILGPRDSESMLDDAPRIVFFCPPYAMWESEAEPLAKLFQVAMEHSPPGSLIVAETDKQFDPDALPKADWDHRLYGGTRLSFTEPPMICGLRM